MRTAHLDAGPKVAACEVQGVAKNWSLDPDHLNHEFCTREGELLVPFAEEEPVIRSRAVSGFRMKREWLNPRQLPAVRDCLADPGLG